MSEIIDRVANAMFEEAKLRHDDTNNPATWRDLAEIAIEAMRDVPDICYDGYRCDKVWKELNSKEVWNLWLDAALQ